MKTVCICGGGSLGHVITGYLSAHHKDEVRINMLTTKPSLWSHDLSINTPDGTVLKGHIDRISSDPKDVIPQSDIVLICLPGNSIRESLMNISASLSAGTYLGCIFASTGFFSEAFELIHEDVKLWGFQRVPFIARTVEYGHSANLLGYKATHKIAVERASEDEKEDFRALIEELFGSPTILLNNHLEASITNSNPLLHTSRLYTMFKDWKPGVTYPRNYLFYEEWTEEAARLYIAMDDELAKLIEVLPVASNFLPRVLDYYESNDPVSLKNKLSSIEGFRGIMSPMKEIAEGQWVPDFSSRYFIEDFGLSLKFLYELCGKYNIEIPVMERIYNWGKKYLDK